MPRILILYHRTGNTEKMAEAVSEGARSVTGAEVEMKYDVTPEELANFDALAVGIPTYHHDMTSGIKNLFEEAAVKKVRLKNKFEMQVTEPPLLVKDTPDQAGLEKCRELGKRIAETCLNPPDAV